MYMLSFSQFCQTNFQSSIMNLHSHQQCMIAPVAPLNFFFFFSHSGGCKDILHYSYNLSFIEKWMQFICLVAIWMFSFVKCLQAFCTLFLLLYSFVCVFHIDFLMFWRRTKLLFIYILDSNHLLNIYIVQIYSTLFYSSNDVFSWKEVLNYNVV